MSILKSRPLPSPVPRAPGNIPPGYRGPAHLPTGRPIYWTGRVAIGLRHVEPRGPTSASEDWLQRVVCGAAS